MGGSIILELIYMIFSLFIANRRLSFVIIFGLCKFCRGRNSFPLLKKQPPAVAPLGNGEEQGLRWCVCAGDFFFARARDWSPGPWICGGDVYLTIS